MGEKTAWFVNKLGEVCVMHMVLYEIECQGCKSKYVGESQKCLYKRHGARQGLRESRQKISIMEALHRKAWEGTTRVQNIRDWSVW